MKTASKIFSVSATALGLVLLIGSAQAADAPVAPAMTATPDAPATAPAATATPAAMPALPAPASSSNPNNRAKNISALEDKVSDSVKGVVKQLSTIDSVNLDDLNTARQAVVKLELLIDIEKHLAELDKLHNERSGEKAIAAAIPASALSIPASSMELPKPAVSHPSTHPHSPDFSMPPPAPVRPDVSNISGVDGHYSATIQGKTVRIGDNIADGSTVTGISPKEVTVKSKDGSVHQLKVKGVDQIFGSRL